MQNLPGWIVALLEQIIIKALTPEAVQAAEAWIFQYAMCKLKAMAAASATPLDDEVIAKVAAALGVDLSKCPA